MSLDATADAAAPEMFTPDQSKLSVGSQSYMGGNSSKEVLGKIWF